MAEVPLQHPPGKHEARDATIIAFPVIPTSRETDSEQLSPEELTPDELVDSFLAEYRHTAGSHRDSHDIALRIRQQLDGELLDAEVHQIPANLLPWRQAYLKMSVDGMDLTVDQWDEFEATDEVFKTISDLRRDTRGDTSLTVQRRALEGLQNFRLGTITQNVESNNEDWYRVLDRLFRH